MQPQITARPVRTIARLLTFSCLSSLSAVFAACSSDEASSSGVPGDGFFDGPSGDGQAGDGDGDGNGGGDGGVFVGMGGADNLPEEEEDEGSFFAPVSTGKFLWSANPESGRVALIDVEELSVRVLSAGLFPTFLAAIPGAEPASVVLNVGSSTATRFRVAGDDVLVDAAPTHVGANRWVTSKNWAIAYSVREPGTQADPTEGFQELTLLRLQDEMSSTRLTVGYRPSLLQISADEKRLAVVSEEGITLISLTSTPQATQWIDLGLDAEKRDVSLSGDGSYAVVRRSDEAEIEVIDLDHPDDRRQVTFDAHVTDLDLSAQGRGVAVVRERNQLATFLLDDLLKDASDFDTVTIEGQLFGSAALTKDGSTAVLYTNATPHDLINIVDLSPGDGYLTHRTVNTQAPVYSVASSPDGEHAIVLSADDENRRGSAFSAVALRSERFPRIVGAQQSVSQVALANDFGIMTATGSGSTHEAFLVSFPSLSVSRTELSAAPLSVGVLPDVGVAFVAQEHAEGRVTFFEAEGEQAQTLTGFELSAEVVDR